MHFVAKLRRVQQAWLPMRRWLTIARGPVRAGKIPSLPAFPETTPRQKANLFQEMTADDLFDQMSTPDIRDRVIQILEHLGDDELLEYRSILRDRIWDQRTAAHVVLTWYAWRFRPKSFLAMGPIDTMALAAVALTSPATPIFCLPDVDTSSAHANPRCLRRIVKAVNRNGYQGWIRLERRGSFSRTASQAFDLILVNGSRGHRPFEEGFFRQCALGGLVVGKRVCSWGLGESQDFRVLEGPRESGIALAFRVKPAG